MYNLKFYMLFLISCNALVNANFSPKRANDADDTCANAAARASIHANNFPLPFNNNTPPTTPAQAHVDQRHTQGFGRNARPSNAMHYIILPNGKTITFTQLEIIRALTLRSL